MPKVTTHSLYPECIANLKLQIDAFYRKSRSGINIAKCNITTGLFGLIGIGQTSRNFFSAEDYTNMSYYNCCGIRPKHSNISKRVGEGVITICVVLDQSTVIFQKIYNLQFVWY